MTSSPRIALRAEVDPAVWTAGGLTDVRFRLTLVNEGDREAPIYPAAARLADTGAGIAWQLQFRGAAGPIHQQELRQWHGPPGTPPSRSMIKQSAEIRLAPGSAHEAILNACWIPNARLSPAHLDPQTLDPTGMDNIAENEIQKQWPAHIRVPPLAHCIPLAQASVLMYGLTAATVEPLMAARSDFLRAGFSTVVAFFVAPGDYELEVAYMQGHWVDPEEQLAALAPPTTIQIAG